MHSMFSVHSGGSKRLAQQLGGHAAALCGSCALSSSSAGCLPQPRRRRIVSSSALCGAHWQPP